MCICKAGSVQVQRLHIPSPLLDWNMLLLCCWQCFLYRSSMIFILSTLARLYTHSSVLSHRLPSLKQVAVLLLAGIVHVNTCHVSKHKHAVWQNSRLIMEGCGFILIIFMRCVAHSHIFSNKKGYAGCTNMPLLVALPYQWVCSHSLIYVTDHTQYKTELPWEDLNQCSATKAAQ